MVWDNALLSAPLLRSIAPKSLAGYARFREATDKDGALPARLKALYIAVAATMKGYEAMAKRELSRGRELGLKFCEAASGAAILCSVRGEGAALRFLSVLEAEYPDRSDPSTPAPDIIVAEDEARNNFLAYFNVIPPSLGKLLELVPIAADAYYLMRQGTLGGTAIGQKYAEMLLVAVLAADYSPLASVHINGARKAGASETEICEAILCSVPVSGLSGWVVGANAMDA